MSIPAGGNPNMFAAKSDVFSDTSNSRSSGLYRRFGKRLMDICAVTAALPIVLPLLLLPILLIARDGHNPFYSQMRIGRGGRTYRMWKLRSMVVDADAKLAQYLDANPEAKAEWERTQKLKNDPRITKIGRILRKTSLDELPQLFNVLKGDMSLIGPRPMMVNQKDLYTGKDYYELRPGITGLWQVSSRNESAFIDRVRYDGLYNKELSLKTDAIVLLKTARVVVKGTGY